MKACMDMPKTYSLVALAALCSTLINPAHGQDVFTSLRIDEAGETLPDRGVSFAEAFEVNFNVGSGCGQNGWTCAPAPATQQFEIVYSGISGYGNFSARTTSDGTGAAVQGVMRSPIFPLETGRVEADIIISDANSPCQFNAVNTLAGAGFFNTRVQFEPSGTINVLQLVPGNCSTGVFVAANGTWTPGVKMRMGIEVLPNAVLRLYKDGVQIFEGVDIAQSCNPNDPDIGINQIRDLSSNITDTNTTFTLDNVGNPDPCTQLPLPFCRTDVAGANNSPPDGATNVSDLLTVINTWGQTQNPPGSGPRPKGDCHPTPLGDCLVNVSDLLAVISGWGPCPVETRRCCFFDGSCQVIGQQACTSSGGTWGHLNSNCTPNVCPQPPPPDVCGGAIPINIGQQLCGNLSDAEQDNTPTCNGVSSTKGKWYKVTGNGTTLTATTCGSNQGQFYDSRINVYCGPDCDTLFCAGGANSNTCGLFESVTWCSINGQDYWILVHTDDAAGEGQFCLQVTSGATCNNPDSCSPPTASNDECTTAIAAVMGDNTVDNTYATNSQGVPEGTCGVSQCSTMGRDVWFTFTPSAPAVYVFNMCQNSPARDYMMQVLANTCGTLVHVAGDDDTCGGGGYPQVITTLTVQQYYIRIGNWCQTPACAPPSGVPGVAMLNIALNSAVCGNGQIEPGEQCDDPSPGCINCQVVATCPPIVCTVTDPEPCLVDGSTDTTNGGCNSSPAVFGNVTAGSTVCATVSTYLTSGGANSRDTDWYLYTVGPSGTVRVDFTSPIPTASFLITSGSTCPASGVSGLGWSNQNACASYQVNNLTPGSQVVVFFSTGNADGSAIFVGFPCGNPSGNTYRFRVTSP